MLIRWATINDRADWQAVAVTVAEIFGAPDMPESNSFCEYMDSKISKYEALTAVDRISGKCLGFIGFSRTNNRISWFGVLENKRSRGIGSRLLKTALRQLDTTKEITVTTFCKNYQPGLPARMVYERFGFVDKEQIEHEGQPRSLMSRPSSDEIRGSSFHYRYPEFIRAAEQENCPVCNGEPAPDGQSDIKINNTVWV